VNNDSQLADDAVRLVELLVGHASQSASWAERHRLKRFASLLDNDAGKIFVSALTDEVLRVRDPRHAAHRFTNLVTQTDLRFTTITDRTLLRAASRFATWLPRPVMALVQARIGREAAHVVVPAEDPALARHIGRREAQGLRLNLNVLGEAVLGEEEAERRSERVIQLLQRSDTNYVSVKLSSISSRMKVFAFDETVAEVAVRLQSVYRQAAQHDPPKFVNLDMEEFRDLRLTIDVLKAALADGDLVRLDVGIVLQAYLPESVAAADEIAEWAVERYRNYGARTKIRLVKGANLAMEQVDAEIHGWRQAPFGSKAETDANFKRLLDRLLDPSFDPAVQIGLGSHNLFDVAWGLVVAADRGGLHRLEIEMLEGMAPAQARAVRDHTGELILYTPTVAHDDLVAAIAYLARRLDENTAPDNYLRHVASLRVGGIEWNLERDRFLQAVHDRHLPLASFGRSQNRLSEDRQFATSEFFHNEPDTDFSSAANRRWITANVAAPVASHGNKILFDKVLIDRIVTSARLASEKWAAVSPVHRRAVLHCVAEVIAKQRGTTIATMIHDAGKTVLEGDPEVSEAIDFARYYAESSRILHTFDDVSFQPHRVVLVTPPWNFPYAIPAGGVFAALAAGSAVILKPAPETVRTARLLAEQCWAGGVPLDLLQFVPCADDDIGRYLVTHSDVDAVILTGGYETAQLFHEWRPDLELHAETSGKNAIVITAAADLDAAVRDLVRSAFGHSGQKCSAASLAIVEGSVYNDPAFLRQLRDATASLVIGPAWDPRTDIVPLIHQPSGATFRALTTLDAGESWLVAPRVSPDNPHLWSPGIRLGVRRGSWFQQTECFSPVLGVIRVENLNKAIEVQNDTAFGLTAGIHSLDPQEVNRWTRQVHAGNLYINRTITGAIVGRQPFGGWKRSSVGPTAKAGGPNYVMTLGTWHQITDSQESETLDPKVLEIIESWRAELDEATLVSATAAAKSFARWWREEFSIEHDPSGLRSESNALRYRPFDEVVILRVVQGVTTLDIAVAVIASVTTGVPLCISTAIPLMFHHHVNIAVESDEELANRLSVAAISRLRAPGNTSTAIAAAAHVAEVVVDTAPIVRNGRIELIHWVREQSVTECQHRYGLIRPHPGG
jgi:RHH-type proline utilization regulon transcriptional repressor/proline dehydrogenase/delta 1-pyrroline-5-carboxylate dehydrogenase